MFDPWTANVSEMEETQADWLASGRERGPLDPVSQFWAVANVAARKVVITVINRPNEASREVLWCVRACLSHGLIAPEWLASEFARRFNAVFSAKAGSWSDPLAFGEPYPKGMHLAAWRKGLVNGPKVVSAVKEMLKSEPQTPVDKQLFERIGRPLGLGATLAEELY